MSSDNEFNDFSDFDLEEAKTVYASRKSINKNLRLTPRPRISASDKNVNKNMRNSFMDKSAPD